MAIIIFISSFFIALTTGLISVYLTWYELEKRKEATREYFEFIRKDRKEHPEKYLWIGGVDNAASPIYRTPTHLRE